MWAVLLSTQIALILQYTYLLQLYLYYSLQFSFNRSTCLQSLYHHRPVLTLLLLADIMEDHNIC